MNVAEVRQLGEALRAAADKLAAKGHHIDRLATSAAWDGPAGQRFRANWRRHRLALERAVIDLRGFGQAALNNASEQERTSSAGGSGATGSWAGGSIKARDLPKGVTFERESHGIDSSSSFGFIVRGFTKAGSSISYLSNGRATTAVTVETGTSFDLDDVKRLADIAGFRRSLAKGIATDSAGIDASFSGSFSDGLRIRSYMWEDQDAGPAGSVHSHFVGKQASAGNQWWAAGEFDEDDVNASLRAREVPEVTAMRRSTAAHSGEMTIGASAGSHGESITVSGQAQKYVYSNASGDTAVGVSYESSTRGSATLVGAELGPFGAQAGVNEARLTGGSVEVVRNPHGEAIAINVTEKLTVSAGSSVDISGFWGTTRSVNHSVERSLSFDLTDSRVAAAFGSNPTAADALARYRSADVLGTELITFSHGDTDAQSSGVWTAGGEFGSESSVTTSVRYRAPGSTDFLTVN